MVYVRADKVIADTTITGPWRYSTAEYKQHTKQKVQIHEIKRP